MTLTLSHGGRVIFSVAVLERQPEPEPDRHRYDPASVTDCRLERAEAGEASFGFTAGGKP